MKVNSQYLGEEVVQKLKDFVTEGKSAMMLNKFVSVAIPRIVCTGREDRPDLAKYSYEELYENSQTEFLTPLRDYVNRAGMSIEHIEYREFTRGDFTLVHDDLDSPEILLIIDITPVWDADFGGGAYFYEDDGFVPLHMEYGDAAIVCEQPCLTFVKYINHYAEEMKRKFLWIRLSRAQ